MSRPPKHQDIGPALVDARAEGVPWKVLEQRYGLGRRMLWLIWRAAAAQSWPDDYQTSGR